MKFKCRKSVAKKDRLIVKLIENQHSSIRDVPRCPSMHLLLQLHPQQYPEAVGRISLHLPTLIALYFTDILATRNPRTCNFKFDNLTIHVFNN